MKVLVLGLDGATWKVLKPLIDFGILSNFKKLVNHGCSGILSSTIPPNTSPAWPCMATGLNPGELGVFSTLMRTGINDFHLKPVNSSVYKSRAFWDILSKNNYRVAIVNMPFLYPVYKVNGLMISGFGTTGKFCVYPSHLYKKVMNGPSRLLESKVFNMLETKNLDELSECVVYINYLKKIINEETEITLELENTISWDLLFYVISPTDWLQHAFMDKILKLVSKIEKNEILDILDKEILAFYQLIDQIVGQFLKLLNRDGVLFVVSDHGFTVRPLTFNISKWLVQEGYMKIRRDALSSGKKLINDKIIGIAKAVPKDFLIKILPRKFLSYFGSKYIEAYVKSDLDISQQIDFKDSRIFCLEDSEGIYVNPHTSNNEILDKLIKDLKNTLENHYGLKLEVFKGSEIYRGKKAELAPDLIIRIRDGVFIWEKSTDINKPLVFKPRTSGIHDGNGIFVAYGPIIKEDTYIEDLKIFDIAPTILDIFNLGSQKSMDGRVMQEIFNETYDIQRKTISYQNKGSINEDLIRRIESFKKRNMRAY